MSYELLPAGEYLAVAVASEGPDGNGLLHLSVTKNGHDQLVARFSILEGEHKGRTVTWFGSLSTELPKQMPSRNGGSTRPPQPPCVHTLKGLRAMGFDGGDINDAFTQPLDETVRIVVSVNEYNGKVTNRVEWVNPVVAKIVVTPPDDNRRRLLLAKMNSYLGPGVQRSEQAPRRKDAVDDGNDIPF